MKKLFFLFVFIQFYSVSGQIIDGTVTYDQDNKAVRKARIDFVCDQDTFYTTYTDEKGYFEYCGKYCEKQFTIIPSKKDFHGYKSTGVLNDTIYIYTYQLRMTRMLVENFCNAAYFEIGSSKDFDFDVESFKEIFEEYPMMCIKTVCALYPGEPESLVAKRLKSFKAILVGWQIPIERIQFTPEIYHLKVKTSDEFESRCPNLPSISFMVTSMEGDCP